jgi:hypothetical protein
MENKNTTSKKEFYAHNSNEDSEAKQPSDMEKAPDSILTDEIEIDTEGNKTTVHRARNVDGLTTPIPDEERKYNENASLRRGVTNEAEAMKTVENEDLNSDITVNRYPNFLKDNHKDRGNMKSENE